MRTDVLTVAALVFVVGMVASSIGITKEPDVIMTAEWQQGTIVSEQD